MVLTWAEAVVTAVKHAGCKVLHNGCSLDMQIVEHGIGLPTAHELNPVRSLGTMHTNYMRQRVEALKDFSMVHVELDGLELLKLIKNQALNFSSKKMEACSPRESTRRFFQLTQGKMTPTQAYFGAWNTS
jgi:hypothetical protein